MCRAAGEPLAIEEIVVDPPKEHEVRIRIICTSLCHSDVTFWRMKVWLSCKSPAIDLVVALTAVAYTASGVSYTSSVCVNFAGFPWHFPQNIWPRSLRVSARYTVPCRTNFFSPIGHSISTAFVDKICRVFVFPAVDFIKTWALFSSP